MASTPAMRRRWTTSIIGGGKGWEDEGEQLLLADAGETKTCTRSEQTFDGRLRLRPETHFTAIDDEVVMTSRSRPSLLLDCCCW